MNMRTEITGISIIVGLLLWPIGTLAAETTVVLTVHHAGCVLCGPIVERTLAQVKGVRNVSVDQADGNADVIATVDYDNAQTSPAAMIKATTDHGYPAQIAKRPQG